MIIADRLQTGDTIGIVSPSHVATVEQYAARISSIESMGFRVKTGKNLYKDTYGYIASEAERADDFNQMIADDEVSMVFFGGGEGSIDLLPMIDYEAIKRHPKLFLSYSDGTSILNAIHAKTGLVTYYGQAPGHFAPAADYTYEQFSSHFLRGDARTFVSNSTWHSLTPGICEGILVGGYTLNFALAVNSPYFAAEPSKPHILFLEDHEKFNNVAAVSMLLSHIGQSPFMDQVSGLLFGNYSDTLSSQLLDRLKRFGEVHRIPVAYCDDFGHGANHGILPIGCWAVLDTRAGAMEFVYQD